MHILFYVKNVKIREPGNLLVHVLIRDTGFLIHFFCLKFVFFVDTELPEYSSRCRIMCPIIIFQPIPAAPFSFINSLSSLSV